MSRDHPQSSRDAATLRVWGWLVLDERGGLRLTRKEGRLAPGERAIKLAVEVPRSIFRTPQLKATVTIPKDQSPEELVAKTQGLADQLGAGLGMTVTVIAPEAS